MDFLYSIGSDIGVLSKDIKDLAVSARHELQQRKAHKALMQWQESTLERLTLQGAQLSKHLPWQTLHRKDT